MVIESTILALHQALLAGEPTAPRRLVDACRAPLHAILKRQYGVFHSEMDEIAMDAAHDALLALIQHPDRYDPSRGSLMNYLVHVGSNKVKDQLHVRLRWRGREESIGGIVELARVEENKYREGANAPDPWEEPDTLGSQIESLLQELLPDPRDRLLWELICQGRTAVADYAAVLAITHLPPCQQRIEVKRNRDRVQKRVRRQQDRFRRLL